MKNARVTAVRRIQFCAGHRVHRHESKCRNLHGHNYQAFFHAEADELDELGRVIDFSVLKERMGTWIDENWDHGFVVCKDDTEALAVLRQVTGQKLFVLDVNPTAENMALELLNVVAPMVLAGTGVRMLKVVLWETENCFVEVEVSARVETATVESRIEVVSSARR